MLKQSYEAKSRLLFHAIFCHFLVYDTEWKEAEVKMRRKSGMPKNTTLRVMYFCVIDLVRALN